MPKKEIAGGQGRHFMGAAGGMALGASAADTEAMEAFQTLLNSIGVKPEAQTALGAILVLGAAWMSYRNKAATKG